MVMMSASALSSIPAAAAAAQPYAEPTAKPIGDDGSAMEADGDKGGNLAL